MTSTDVDYAEVDKSSVCDLDVYLEVQEVPLADDTTLGLCLCLKNSTNKPVFIPNDGLRCNIYGKGIDKNKQKYFDREFIGDRDFLRYNGDFYELNKIPANRVHSVPLYVFVDSAADLIFKEDVQIIKALKDNYEFTLKIEFIIPQLDEADVNISLSIDREKLAKNIGDIKGIDNYEEYLTVDKI